MTSNVGVGSVVFLVLVLSTVRDMDSFRGKEGKMVSCKGKEGKMVSYRGREGKMDSLHLLWNILEKITR